MLHLLPAQLLVSRVHVAHDDGDMLKPMVRAARVRRNAPALVREMLRERDAFVAEFQFRRAQLRVVKAEQFIGCAWSRRGFRHFLKRKDFRVELQRAVKVADGQPDRAHLAHCCRR